VSLLKLFFQIERFCCVSAATVYKNGTVFEMPFKSEMTLLSAVNAKPGFTESTKAFLISEILNITEALHNAKIIHADIKPDNFLVVPDR
jgi:serine/threonine protein kinase